MPSPRLIPRLTLLLAAAAAAWSGLAWAQDPPVACALTGQSMVDAAINPPGGEDEDFLGARNPGLPILAFVVDASSQMRKLPIDITSAEVRLAGLGCSNTIINTITMQNNRCVDGKGQAFVPLPAGCNAATLQPDGYGLPYNTDALGGVFDWTYYPYDPDLPGLFTVGSYYVHDRGWGVDGRAVEAAWTFLTPDAACTAAGALAVELPECSACLTSRGYWLPPRPDEPPPLAGEYLNFNPPKHVLARKVLKDQFAALDFPSRKRQSMLTTVVTSNDRCFSPNLLSVGMDPLGRDGAEHIAAPTMFKPPCGQYNACLHNGSLGGGRAAFDNAVNGKAELFTTPPLCPVPLVGAQLPSDRPAWATQVVFANAGKVPAQDGSACRAFYEDALGTQRQEAVCAPYAESILNAGQYLGELARYDTLFPASLPLTWRKPALDTVDGTCPPSSCGCPRPSIILIAGGGPSFDDNLPCEITGIGCAQVVNPLPGSGCASLGPGGNLARVARLLATSNMKPSGVYSVPSIPINTYVIGLGTENPDLVAAAENGGGAFIKATDATSLASSINEVLRLISGARFSFSNANISAVQTRTTSALIVPRFTASKRTFWPGTLTMFEIFNEDACGCRATTAPAPLHACDLNQDRLCGGVFFKDGDGSPIASDSQGVFRKATLSAGVFSATLASPLARPLWEVGTGRFPEDRMLAKVGATGQANSRRVFTAVDSNGDGYLDYQDNTISFDENSVDALLPYFALDTQWCSEQSARLGTCLDLRQCALKLIQYVRGMDVFNEDCNAVTSERNRKLGDIFHSSPVVVEPPVSTKAAVCRLGVANQCLVSLAETATVGGSSYQTYVTANRGRNRVVLVGANDGMLHAFHAGTHIAADNPATPPPFDECPNPPTVCPGYYDNGTGDELWAFIPPDQLPKLRLLLDEQHQYFVDATPMVRDIWADENGNGQKEATEFHTVAVVGERRGGNVFFALDVTDPAGPGLASAPGFFRWIFPQPETPVARLTAQSYADFLPTPPPIGPVRLRNDASSQVYGGVRFEERWVALLNGGFDQQQVRGGQVNMVDVWWGGKGAGGLASKRNPIWNWDMPNPQYSVAATPGMVAFGPGPKADPLNNGLFFDTATFGDVGGRLWALRFNNPDPSTWTGKQVMDQVVGNTCSKNPFFQVTSNLIHPEDGRLQTLAGTGDRFNLQDVQGGECSITNLTGCLRRGCKLKKSKLEIEICDGEFEVERKFDGANSATSCAETDGEVDVELGTPTNCCDEEVEGKSEYEMECTNSNGSTVTMKWKREMKCKRVPGTLCGGPTNNFLCKVNKQEPFDICSTFDRCTDGSIAATVPRNAFYSVRVFADLLGRRPFNSSAATYGPPLRRTDLVAVDAYNPASAVATITSNGWFAQYASPAGRVYPTGLPFTPPVVNERTATQATVFDNCAFWSSYTPSGVINACGNTGTGMNTRYRLNYLTGGTCEGLTANLAARYDSQTGSMPPTPVQPVITIDPTGLVRLSVAEPPREGNTGGAATATLNENSDVISDAYSLEVSRGLHACRHPQTADPRDFAAQALIARTACIQP